MSFRLSELREAMNATTHQGRKEVIYDILARHRGDPDGVILIPITPSEEQSIRKALEELKASKNPMPMSS